MKRTKEDPAVLNNRTKSKEKNTSNNVIISLKQLKDVLSTQANVNSI